ncbi:MAG: UDP-2,4-diacetamido-2,4,6-trideoxy-beta-L-altropyranose hydrolase [Paracoccaceae bacterium]
MSRSLLFRVDASTQVGSGHLARCLTLANEASLQGWSAGFALRDPTVEITEKIKMAGHELYFLKDRDTESSKDIPDLAHSHWLPVSQKTDAIETNHLINKLKPDCLVIDHYAIDARWHDLVRDHCKKLLVIDDLADRTLNCDILLNQNLGVSTKDYFDKITQGCSLLLGPQFALLKPEFGRWREFSLKRRQSSNLHEVLITMGGADEKNKTLKILRSLESSDHAFECEITVIVGPLYKFNSSLEQFIQSSALKVSKMTDINNMAEIMSKSDICIGAAGSSSWERCALGLPTLTFAIAENQTKISSVLDQRDVAIATDMNSLNFYFDSLFHEDGKKVLKKLSLNSQDVCDGFGAQRVVQRLDNIPVG